MSHWTDIKTACTSLDVLETAVKEFGATMKIAAKNKKVFATGFNGAVRPCDAVIKHKEWEYDIAIDRQEDGTLSLVTDWFDRKADSIGVGFSRVVAYYGAHKATAECQRRGKRVEMNRITKGKHEVQRNGTWVSPNAGIVERILKMLPFRDKKRAASQTDKLWVEVHA